MNQISPGVWWSLQSWLPQYLGHSQGTFLTCNKIFLCFPLIHFDSLYPLFDPKLIWNDMFMIIKLVSENICQYFIQKNSLIITNLKYCHLWLQFFYIKIHILFNYANYDCHRVVCISIRLAKIYLGISPSMDIPPNLTSLAKSRKKKAVMDSSRIKAYHNFLFALFTLNEHCKCSNMSILDGEIWKLFLVKKKFWGLQFFASLSRETKDTQANYSMISI